MLAALAAFQPAETGQGAQLTLGTGGVVALIFLLAAAASGWILYALTRRPAPPSPPPAAPPGPPPRKEPIEEAFEGAVLGGADAALACAQRIVRRAHVDPGSRIPLVPAEAEGRRLLDLCGAEHVLPLVEALRTLESGKSRGGELLLSLPAAGGASCHVRAKLVRPDGGAPGDLLVTLADVTGTEAMARAAAEIESRVEAAISHFHDAVVITSIESGREIVVLANDALAPVLGLRGQEMIGTPLAALPARSGRQSEDARRLFDAAEGEGPVLLEIATEPPRLVERSTRWLGEPPGSRGRLFIFRDRTLERIQMDDLKRSAREAEGAREALARRHEEVLLANEGLERRMADLAKFGRELKSLDEMKSSLLGNVSHELQTPLVSIKGYTEMMLKGRLGPLTAEQERGLKVALRNADRLIGLIDGLLAFVRAERDATPLKIEIFPLRPLVEEEVSLLEEMAAAKRVKISVAVPPGDLLIRADRARIGQVLVNLLTNAIKYNREGGEVSVEAARSTRSLARVEVRDTGTGIPREEIERIFERFYRSEGTREKGTGLGLAIAKDILRLHGCMIRVDSEPGRGSVFSFTLPLEGRGRPDKAARTAETEKDEA